MLGPRITLLRVMASAGTAGIGYISYKLKEGQEWLEEKVRGFKEGLSGAMDGITTLPFRRSPGVASQEEAHFDTDNVSNIKTKVSDTLISPNIENTGFSGFVGKMIEVDSLLRQTDGNSSISLPRIVVIGSQSSGKSSVLESLVGHSFLPTGASMVTRRPLLLNLVHDEDAVDDFATIHSKDGGSMRFDDFHVVSERLRELNLAVRDGEWVSVDPIEIDIHSKRLPDLGLIDLPGYIAVNNRRQPAELRSRIASLCEPYLAEPNIILAVSPADVDLANSEALLAARRADPRGTRTIGVLTKIDLVTPEHAVQLLSNEDYCLEGGYVGIIAARPQSSSLGRSTISTVRSFESDYFFHQHNEVFHPVKERIGTNSLVSILQTKLEDRLRGSLGTVLKRVSDELADARYELKVRYGDRIITPTSYLAEVITRVREGIAEVSRMFTKAAVKSTLERGLFDRHLVDLLLSDDVFLSDQIISQNDLDELTIRLTRAGWGRKAAIALSNELQKELSSRILGAAPLRHHPTAVGALSAALDASIRSRVSSAADQIENALRPYKKSTVEFDVSEWLNSKQGIMRLLERELNAVRRELLELTEVAGGLEKTRKLVQRAMSDKINDSTVGAILSTWQRQKRIHSLIKRISSNQCCSAPSSPSEVSFMGRLLTRFHLQQPDPLNIYSTEDNHLTMQRDKCQYGCPAVHLYLISRRLLTLSTLYGQDELSPEQHARLAESVFEGVELKAFVRENREIAEHLLLIDRLNMLERVKERLLYIYREP